MSAARRCGAALQFQVFCFLKSLRPARPRTHVHTWTYARGRLNKMQSQTRWRPNDWMVSTLVLTAGSFINIAGIYMVWSNPPVFTNAALNWGMALVGRVGRR